MARSPKGDKPASEKRHIDPNSIVEPVRRRNGTPGPGQGSLFNIMDDRGIESVEIIPVP